METKENDDSFHIIIQHKDISSSNLKEKFDSYGLERLESKVPVVRDPIVDKLQTVDSEQQSYAIMALSSDAAQKAVEGRVSRTRNKVLKLVTVGDQTMIATGETRERSPVDENELDAEIEEYMREKAKRKAEEASRNQSLPGFASTSSNRVVGRVTTRDESDLDEEDLDVDLDNYMKEAKRKKEQLRKLEEHSERARALERMELDFDDERFEGNFDEEF